MLSGFELHRAIVALYREWLAFLGRSRQALLERGTRLKNWQSLDLY